MESRLKLEAFYLLMNTPPVFNSSSALQLLASVGTVEEFWNLNKLQINNLAIESKLKEKLIAKLENDTLSKLSEQIKKLNAQIVVCSDDFYPERLKKYKYSPLMLFYKGDINLLNNTRLITIVGTRKSSSYGEALVESVVRDISTHKYPVLTGTAKGIDTKVIESSLVNKTRCISVLSSGIDSISPKESSDLLDEIIKHGGCYLTEFPPGVASFKSNYAIRAKLLAILATEIIIIEAPKNSGAILVAKEGFQLSRNVFCLPSYHNDANFWGSHNLIDDGTAVLVRNFDDVKNYCTF